MPVTAPELGFTVAIASFPELYVMSDEVEFVVYAGAETELPIVQKTPC